jgi:hypothetical protein
LEEGAHESAISEKRKKRSRFIQEKQALKKNDAKYKRAELLRPRQFE